MSAVLIDIADAIVSRLNAGSFSQSFTASREWAPKLDRIDTASFVVMVVPSGRRMLPATREGGPVRSEHKVSVGVFYKPSGTDAARKTATDEAFSLAQELAEDLMKVTFTVDGEPSYTGEINFDAVFDTEILRDEGVFSSAFTIELGDHR